MLSDKRSLHRSFKDCEAWETTRVHDSIFFTKREKWETGTMDQSFSESRFGNLDFYKYYTAMNLRGIFQINQ
jgi:hypothetical protein